MIEEESLIDSGRLTADLTADQTSSTINSTKSRIHPAAVEVAVTRIMSHVEDSEELSKTKLSNLMKFTNDCNILSIKALFDGPNPEIQGWASDKIYGLILI